MAENVVAKQGLGAWPTCRQAGGTPPFRPDPDLEHHHSGLVHHHRGRPGAVRVRELRRGPLGLIDFGKICQNLTGALGGR